MRRTDPISNEHYALGNTDGEHERLIWQAGLVAPLTERLLREAGIGPGQRVLDLGSGVGDVAMLAARLVRPDGHVVGVERDERSIARAASRAAEAGMRHIEFVRSDVSAIAAEGPFDAVIGRFILMWLPDPAGIVRAACRLVRPGGAVAFQETDWAPLLALLHALPLWTATAGAIHRSFRATGADPDLGPGLYRVFLDAGLPGPTMRSEMPMGRQPQFARWFYELACTLGAQDSGADARLAPLGHLSTLQARLQHELDASAAVAALPASVLAWCRKGE